MSNIPTNASLTQSILNFHQELTSIFEKLEAKDKFLTAMNTQNVFMTEAREYLTPLLSDIGSDECLIVELWIKEDFVFDGDYYKAKLSSPTKDSNINRVFSHALIYIKLQYNNLIPVVFIFRESITEKRSHL